MTMQSFFLCLIYTLYLVLGGLMFTYLEYEVRKEVEMVDQPNWKRLKELTEEVNLETNDDNLITLTEWLREECKSLPQYMSLNFSSEGNRIQMIEEIEANCPLLKNSVINIFYEYPWSIIHSIYFSMTVITTIGYGHISPNTIQGKIVCILYSLIGIPLTLVLLARTSTFFGRRLYNLFTSQVDAEKQRSKIFIALGAFLYILFGFVIFIFLPAVLFMFTEQWTYINSVYFSYITLTTIGFGDFVTGSNMEDPWLTVYQIGVILWIMSGLGYWVMVANFMVLALKSDKVYAMAKKVSELKKIVSQLNGNQNNPQFLNQSSKPSINFLMQLASILAVPEMEDIPMSSMQTTFTSNGALNRPVIPGIAALFNKSLNGGMPLFQKVLKTGLNDNHIKTNSADISKKDSIRSVSETRTMERAHSLDSKLASSSLSPTSNLSSSSDFLCENEITSFSLLSDGEDVTAEKYQKGKEF